MKIAYIMLCHKNPKQINKLIEALTHEESDFYIQIDKKIEFKNEICKADNVYIVDDSKRVDIKWGQISMIEATFNAIEGIIASRKEYDYVWLISGQDYPVKNRDFIIDYLESNRGANFIEVISDARNHQEYLKRTSLYYPKWLINNKTWIKLVKRLYIELTGGYFRTFIKRKNSTGLEFYFGSQWWALSFDFIKYAFDFYNAKPDIINYFENTIIPDEIIFQTIIMNSEYRNTVKDNLTHINLIGNGRNPNIFTANDIDVLKTSKYLLARKFDEDVDKVIFQKINDDLLI